jgi:Mn-dependent DtxR family transcriptional regulator
MEEMKEKILEYLAGVSKAKPRDMAKTLGFEKKAVDKACSELAKDGKIEYLYIGTSYVTLAGRDHTPGVAHEE